MVPYRGRLSLRIARLVLALACLAWYGITGQLHWNWVAAVLAAYAVYALGALPEIRFDSTTRATAGLLADTAYFGLWSWVEPGAWMPAFAACYLLASAVVLFDFVRTLAVALAAVALALVLPSAAAPGLVWTV